MYPSKRKPLNKNDRKVVFEKYNGHCAYCGCDITMQNMQVDHLIPMKLYEKYAEVGVDIDNMDNYMPSCRSCNHYKSSMTLDKFRSMISKMSDVLYRDSATYRNAVRFGQVVPNKKPVVFYFETFK